MWRRQNNKENLRRKFETIRIEVILGKYGIKQYFFGRKKGNNMG